MGVVAEHTQVIDGITYTTRTFPATQGLELIRQLARLVSDEIVTLILGVDDKDVAGLLSDSGVLFQIVRGAARDAEPGAFGDMAKAILGRTTADKVRIGEAEVDASVHQHFDTHFAGRYMHLLEVCMWVLRVGFGGP